MENNNINLTVTREKRIIGFAISFDVLVDNNKIGSLKNGSFINYNLEPGKHIISVKSLEKTVNQEIEINDEHKSVEIIVNLKMGFLAGRANIKEVIYK